MSELLSHYDAWIADSGPSALVCKQYLEPASGPGEVIFPPTFAPPEDSNGAGATYVIDGEGDQAVCLIDSVGSQANRMEPLFLDARYSSLVPQIEVRVKERAINLLQVGHRAADALVRSTALAEQIETAFLQYENGNAVPLAKMAPTSLVFGAWDSRGSQVKVPRLIDSTIRAYGVRRLTRAAQYFASLEPAEVEELISPAAGKNRKVLSKAGFLDAPSGTTHGGIIASGGIVRNTIVNLVALRSIRAPNQDEQTALRRYILGLALVAVLAPQDFFLRQGCLLVESPGKQPQWTLVYRNGRREELSPSLDQVEAFARAAASAFQVGEGRTVDFNPKLAQDLVKKASKEKDRPEA